MKYIFIYALRFFLCGYVLFWHARATAQKNELTSENIAAYIELEPIEILSPLSFENSYDESYYRWFTKKVMKAYPFAEMTYKRMNIMDKRLQNIKSKQKRKKYIKIVQKYIEKELTPRLKKLTRTEGRVLLKLIYRNSGITAFEVVKKYRSSWKAFWYNVTANIFTLSLKVKYNPLKIEEDHMIEDILRRASAKGEIILLKSQVGFKWDELPQRNFRYPPKLLKKYLKK